MRKTLNKKVENAWDKEIEVAQTTTSIERLELKAKAELETRFTVRKYLDKNYASTIKSKFAITKGAKSPNVTDPVSIEALGSLYPVQK